MTENSAIYPTSYIVLDDIGKSWGGLWHTGTFCSLDHEARAVFISEAKVSVCSHGMLKPNSKIPKSCYSKQLLWFR